MRAAGNPYNTSCRDRLWGLGGGIGGRQVTASACATAVALAYGTGNVGRMSRRGPTHQRLGAS